MNFAPKSKRYSYTLRILMEQLVHANIGVFDILIIIVAFNKWIMHENYDGTGSVYNYKATHAH